MPNIKRVVDIINQERREKCDGRRNEGYLAMDLELCDAS
jgi:hypothetical protein